MRLRVWMIAIAGLVWWLRCDRPRRELDLVAGTARETFAILDRSTGRLTEIAQLGAAVRELDVPVTNDTRVVGTGRGTALVWPEGERIALAHVDDLDHEELFGKRVERLCAETATTHMMFGFAWVERDRSISIARRSSFRGAGVDVDTLVADAEPGADPYCAITNADHDVAVLYRYGDRTELARCEEGKRCGKPRQVAIDGRDTILGVGCTWHFCMVATRTRDGVTTLHWLDENARTITTRDIAACKDRPVHVAGEGERFAIAYSTGPDPVVDFADDPGKLRRVWAGGDASTTPALSWMGNVLLIASQRGGKLQLATLIL